MHGSYKLNIIEHQQTQMNNKTNEILSLKEHFLYVTGVYNQKWFQHITFVLACTHALRKWHPTTSNVSFKSVEAYSFL